MTNDMHPLGLEPRTYGDRSETSGAEVMNGEQVSGEEGGAQSPNPARNLPQRGDEGGTADSAEGAESGDRSTMRTAGGHDVVLMLEADEGDTCLELVMRPAVPDPDADYDAEMRIGPFVRTVQLADIPAGLVDRLAAHFDQAKAAIAIGDHEALLAAAEEVEITFADASDAEVPA